MRDPDGFLEESGVDLVRNIRIDSSISQFFSTKICSHLMAEGLLMPFEFRDSSSIVIKKIGFVSSPLEWCDAQFRAAGELTLEIADRVYCDGYELKDSSAWNVIFEGLKPIFCDHLSFQKIKYLQWWSFGQYLRHFIFPLEVSRCTGLRAASVFRFARDGLGAEETRRLLGSRRFLTKIWPLLVASKEKTVASVLTSKVGRRTYHPNLYRYCRWALPSRFIRSDDSRQWHDYLTKRNHYSAAAVQCKQEVLRRWLQRTNPKWVVDFGANTGEFTFLAAELGAQVIAIEQDHDCVTKIFQSENDSASIYPVLANLADLSGGSGWRGKEHSSLITRLTGRADMVLVLALIHHLSVSESIPFEKISELIYEVTNSYAVVELIGEADPLLQKLVQQRGRRLEDFSLVRQRNAFDRQFITVDEFVLPDTERHLVLLKKIQNC